MVERSRQDSSRDLLEELEDGWGAPLPPAGFADAPSRVSADRSSSPDLEALDEGWLDDLFPGEDEADDEPEDDEDEPELPDERLDPEAFALAKKAREERAAKKKERRRAKAEAKRARQKARALAMRQKQKSKKARPAPTPRQGEPKRKAANSTRSLQHAAASDDSVDESSDLAVAGLPAPKESKASVRRSPSTMASVKLLAIVLATLLALAAAVAAIMK